MRPRTVQRWSMAAIWLLALIACPRAPRQQQLAHGRFEKLVLTTPESPRSVALMLAPSNDTSRADALSAELTKRGALVTRVDADAFFKTLDATPSGCVFPAGDLDNLAHFIQAYVALPSYQPAVLVGLGVGAELAAAALAQAPPGTFAGALAFDFCGASTLHVPLCANGALDVSRALAASSDPFFALRSSGAAACAAHTPAPAPEPARDDAAFIDLYERLAVAAQARATAAPKGLDDLPIVEVAASGPGHADTFAVLLSGDGGWAGIDQELSARLARRGLPVVGIDSLRYFWRARTPESTALDMQRVIEHYTSVWKRARVVLVGFSQGADVLPFVVNRLPAESRRALVSAVGLSLSTTATFEFHLSSWVGASGDRPTMPEVQRLAQGPLVCVYGKDDHEALCPQLDPTRFRVVQLPGTHHFNGDYERVSAAVLDAIPSP